VIDHVEIEVLGGDGGDGCVSFRREKFVPRGGPDGGDGGDGGSVMLVADRSVRTLKEIGRRRTYRAQRGGRGLGRDKHGAKATALTLTVPEGTLVSWLGDSERRVDLAQAGDAAIVASGGLGGWGNARFATSVNRAPLIAQRGQRGQQARIVLDLKLLADVGIVGLPNAGKSTLLRAMSAARPKVGSYPFTTLEPVLGVAESGWDRFVVADIPGLVEGAHEGVGLGLDFLRHIERTRVLIHLVDGSSDDPLRDMDVVQAELSEYGGGLHTRPQVVAVNKLDLPGVEEKREGLDADLRSRGVEASFIAAAAGLGVVELTDRVSTMLVVEAPAEAVAAEEPRLLQPEGVDRDVVVVREGAGFRVSGQREVAFAEMMPLGSDEGRAELWRRFGRWGVRAALKRAGAKTGDLVLFGEVEVRIET